MTDAPEGSIGATVIKWLFVTALVVLLLPIIMETLRNIWLNYGSSHPYLSTLVVMVVAGALWWAFGLIVHLSMPKETPASTSAQQSAPIPHNSDRFEISNVTVVRPSGTGIVADAPNVDVKSSTVKDGQKGFSLKNLQDSDVIENTAENISGTSFEMENLQRTRVEKNLAKGSPDSTPSPTPENKRPPD